MALKNFSYSDRLVKPEKKNMLGLGGRGFKVARPVEEKDLIRVKTEADILFQLCFTKVGIFKNALAMAHPQIDDQDPLRFFVLATSQAIVNPVIIRQTKVPINSKEGCYTFPDKLPIIVPRSRKITVKYRILARPYDGILSPEKTEEFSGQLAFTFQHEMDHFDCRYIFEVQ